MIFVTNKSGATVKAKHHGTDYEFKPGEQVAIEDLAAQHIFGYGMADKGDAFLRLGWQGTQKDLADQLAKFVFQEAKVEITPVGVAA